MRPEKASTTFGYTLAGHALFIGLGILSLVHWRERVVHVDSAYQIFKWVQKSGVEVEAYRFGAVFPQLLVKCVKWVEPSLEMLLQVASVGHVLVPYLIFILLAHRFQQPWTAAALVLAQVLATRLTFYGIVLEANYLLSYPFLLYAVIAGKAWSSSSRTSWIGVAIALALVLTVHPVGFLIALFVIALRYTQEPGQLRSLSVLAGLSVLWGLLGRKLFPPSGYESELYTSALEGVTQLGSEEENPAWRFLTGHTWDYTTHYVPLWCALILLVVLLVRRQAWLPMALVLCGVVGYTLLNVVTYHIGETAMMMEKNFLPLATLVALPLMFEVQRLTGRAAWIAPLMFVSVLFIQFRGISFASRPAAERYRKVVDLVGQVQQAGIQKAVVSSEQLNTNGYMIHWALPYESLLVSSLEGPERSITIVTVSDTSVVDLPQGLKFPSMDDNFPVDKLNKVYFSMPSGPYVRWP